MVLHYINPDRTHPGSSLYYTVCGYKTHRVVRIGEKLPKGSWLCSNCSRWCGRYVRSSPGSGKLTMREILHNLDTEELKAEVSRRTLNARAYIQKAEGEIREMEESIRRKRTETEFWRGKIEAFQEVWHVLGGKNGVSNEDPQSAGKKDQG